MIKHSFSDFSYAINTTSEKAGYKEILVCYIYNGKEILKKVYIPEVEGTSYIFEAKKIIDEEIRNGSLTIYSRKFIKDNSHEKKPFMAEKKKGDTFMSKVSKKKWVIPTVAAVAAVGLVLGAVFITKGIVEKNSAGSNFYNVTFAASGCVTEGNTKVAKGTKNYSCKITSGDSEHTTAPKIDFVKIGDHDLVAGSEYTFDPSVAEGDNLLIKTAITDNVTICAVAEKIIFNVACDYSSDLTFSGNPTIERNGHYSCNIIPKDSSKRKTNIESVRMGSSLLTPGRDYNFDYNENSLSISKDAVGDISIVANTSVTKYDVTYHVLNCEMVAEESPTEIDVDSILTCTLKQQEGTRKNAIAGVSMGGVKLNTNQYTFDSDNNKLSLKVGATGDIVVSAMSYDPGTDRFKVQFDSGEGCTPISDITDVELGHDITADLKVVNPDTKKVHIDAVVMGGVSLKEGVDYTYNPDETPNFEVFNITSNVLVKFEAVDIGDITATPNYTLNEDGQSYSVKSFKLPSGKVESDIDSVTIDSKYAPENSNAEPLPVTSIDRGILNKFSNLKELSIPFVGAKKLSGSDDPRDGTQLFGYIFGDTPYSGASATWQNYYDEMEVLHTRKFIIPNSLKTVTVTGNDPIIPAGAFSSCRSLDEIKFTEDAATIVKNYAFNGCISLRNVEIPSTIGCIEESVFQNCETLQHIELPVGLTTIAGYAFNNCKSLLKVRLGNQISQVGPQAFTGIRGGVIACEKTKSEIQAISEYWSEDWVDTGTSVVYGAINMEDYIDNTNQFHFMLVREDGAAEPRIGAHIAEYVGDSTQPTITIPDVVTPKDSVNAESYPVFGLGDYMFAEYSVTTKFVFECSQLTSLGSYCFAYCSTLATLENFNNLTKLKEIGAYCFGACLALNISSVPSSVTSIGEYAFTYDYAITSFSIGNNIKSIEEGLFYYCVNLAEVTLPNEITYLGENVFEECYALSSLTINSSGIDAIPYALCYCVEDPDHPERVSKLASFTWNSSTPLVEVGGSAFGGCTDLTSVKLGSNMTANHLPTTVEKVGDYAFTRCTKMPAFYIDKATTGGVSNINMGLEIFKSWTANQTLYINTGWVTGGSWFSTEATLAWGWKMSRAFLDIDGDFHCSKTGSDDLVINKFN